MLQGICHLLLQLPSEQLKICSAFCVMFLHYRTLFLFLKRTGNETEWEYRNEKYSFRYSFRMKGIHQWKVPFMFATQRERKPQLRNMTVNKAVVCFTALFCFQNICPYLVYAFCDEITHVLSRHYVGQRRIGLLLLSSPLMRISIVSPWEKTERSNWNG